MLCKILAVLVSILQMVRTLTIGKAIAVRAMSQGDAEYLRGNLQQAIAYFNRAIEVNPNTANAYLKRAYIHNTLGANRQQ